MTSSYVYIVMAVPTYSDDHDVDWAYRYIKTIHPSMIDAQNAIIDLWVDEFSESETPAIDRPPFPTIETSKCHHRDKTIWDDDDVVSDVWVMEPSEKHDNDLVDLEYEKMYIIRRDTKMTSFIYIVHVDDYADGKSFVHCGCASLGDAIDAVNKWLMDSKLIMDVNVISTPLTIANFKITVRTGNSQWHFYDDRGDGIGMTIYQMPIPVQTSQ